MADPTENTINDLVASYLRNRGLHITTQLSAKVQGERKQPDFELQNHVTLYGEGEWFSSYLKGLTQAIGYGDIPGSSGYFLLGYPESLRKRVSSLRTRNTDPARLLTGVEFRGLLKLRDVPTSIFPKGGIEEIPRWFQAAFEKKPKKDPDEYVSIMRDMVYGLSNYLIDEPIHYQSLFENVVSSLSDKKGKQATARKAAAYLLLNQIVFYHVISREGRVPPLAEGRIKAPGDLFHVFFKTVTDNIDYHAIFDFDVASIFPKKSNQFIVDIVRTIKELAPEDFTRNLLGSLFHKLIPKEVRKPLAAYYTNPAAATLLADLAIDTPDSKVADLACGSGTLLVAAYNRKAALLGKEMTEPTHKRFIQKEITGIDVMPFAAHLAVVQLGLKNPGYLTDKVRIGVHDSTELHPESRIDPLQVSMETGQRKIHDFEEVNLSRLLKKTGAISGQGTGDSFVMGKFDVILMNPPFSRKQHITRDLRSELKTRFKDYEGLVSDEQNYNLYFVFLADRFLEDRAKIAMVLPATMLNQKSSKGFRKLVRRDYFIEFVLLNEYRSAFSEDTSFRDMLFVATKSRGGAPKTDAIFALLKVLPSPTNSRQIMEELTRFSKGRSKSINTSLFRAVRYEQEEVFSKDDWYQLFPGELSQDDIDYSENTVPLNTQVNRIVQGFRYESSSEFVNTADTMISYPREKRVRIDLEILSSDAKSFVVRSPVREEPLVVPKKSTFPAIRTASLQSTIEITEPKDFIIMDRFDGDEGFWTQKDPDQMLVKRREHIETRESNLVMAGYGNIDLGSPGTFFLAFCSKSMIAPTWSFWSLPCSRYEDATLLALWLNSSFALAELLKNRTEVRGTNLKWRKRVIENLAAINTGELTNDDFRRGRSLLDNLNGLKFPCLLEQLETSFEGRMAIDRFFAGLLGKKISDDDITSLHKDLAVRLSKMQKMMSRD